MMQNGFNTASILQIPGGEIVKKHLIVNILVSIAFIVLDPILTWCGVFAEAYSLGAEMVLGMSIPFIFSLFILFIIFSVSFSLYKAIITKDIKQTVPILALTAFAAIYIALSTQGSFWVRFFEYYK